VLLADEEVEEERELFEAAFDMMGLVGDGWGLMRMPGLVLERGRGRLGGRWRTAAMRSRKEGVRGANELWCLGQL
jgi:hypothetical protein